MKAATRSLGERIIKTIKRTTRKQYSSGKRSELSWVICAAKTISPNYAIVKRYTKASITNSRKTLWNLARDAWLAIQLALSRLTRLNIFVVRHVI